MKHAFSNRLPRISRGLAALVLVGVAIAAPRLANADVTFEVPTITVVAGPGNVTVADQTGFFDMLVVDSGSSNFFSYTADVRLPTEPDGLTPVQTDVQFINADISTLTGITNGPSAVYALLGNSEATANNDVPTSVFPNEVFASDVAITAPGNPIVAGVPLGLVRIQYDIAAGTPVGSYGMTINVFPNDPNANISSFASNYQLQSAAAAALTPSVINGAINVVPAPEPSSIVLLVLGAVGLFGFRRLRARQA
jgi:hypothetical protein